MEIEKFITEGLQKGFAGKIEPEKISRGGFRMKEIHYNGLGHEDFDEHLAGSSYRDEWTDGRIGGGQELVHFITTARKLCGEESHMTRLYAGGIIPDEELDKLGIMAKDVRSYLKKIIRENGEKTRLYSNFEPEKEGDWEYSYKILDTEDSIELRVGKEIIRYKEALVFCHYFLLSPVK